MITASLRIENTSLSTKIGEIRISDIGALVWINLLMFQGALQDLIPLLAYLDEITAMGLIIASLFVKRPKRLYRTELLGVSALIICTFTALFGNLLFGYQHNQVAVVLDIATYWKFFLVYLCALRINFDTKRLANLLMVKAKILLPIMAIFAMLNYIGVVDMTYEYKYGLPAFEFLFFHPTFMTFVLVGMVALVLSKKPSISWEIFFAFLLIATGLRTKGLAFCGVAVFFLIVLRKKRKVPIYVIAGAGLVALYIGWDQLSFYLSNDEFARTALTNTSLSVARDCFPLGSGFATYGSNMSGVYYSPLYSMYGLNNIYGMSEDFTSYLTDTFWPIIIAQNGVLGFACFIIGLFLILRSAIVRARNLNVLLPVLCIIVYLLICSTSETSFFNPYSIYLAIMLIVCLNGTDCNGDANMAQRQGR